jgi:multisubunit Na+/H+ antiporter MnhB subunit
MSAPMTPGDGIEATRRRSVILDVAVRAEIHTLLLVSLYFLFAGHNQPGGGFAGGLVASAALCLRHVAGGQAALDRSIPVQPPVLLGAGLLLAVVTGSVPLLFGDQFLESAIVEQDLPVFGHVKFTSVLAFDTGVYLVVLGMAMLLLEQFGRADGAAEEEVDGS